MTTDSGSDYSQDRDVVVAKIISGTCLFVISVICGVIPFKLAQIFKWSEPIDVNGNSKRKSAKVVTALLCFGGGVLLATTFLHLLPEVSAEIANLQSMGMIPQMNLHLAELLMMSGFFLIYLIEEIVHYYLHQYQNKVKKSQASLTMKPEDETFAEAFMRGMSARNSIHRRYSNEGLNNNNSHHGSMILSDTNELKNDSKLSTVLETVQMSNNDTFLTVPNNKVITEKTPNINGHIHEHNNHNHHHRHNHHDSHDHGHTHAHGHSHAIPLPHSADEDMFVSSLRGLLIVLALSIHELFEGFAVGLERTSYGVYYMFAAVCGHKFVISFCIGVELMVQRTTLWLAFLYVIVYSIVSAIGKLTIV